MQIERINMDTLSIEKTKAKIMRIFPCGKITISEGLAEERELTVGGRIEFMKGKEHSIVKYFIAKSNNDKGYVLKELGSGLMIQSSALSKMLIDFFEKEDDEKSVPILVKPEPNEFKSQHGYVAYEIIKKNW